MGTVEDITFQLERALAEATQKIDEFVSIQSNSLSKAAADHDQLMRDMEGKLFVSCMSVWRLYMGVIFFAAKMHRLLEEEAEASGAANTSQTGERRVPRSFAVQPCQQSKCHFFYD